jgi:hypothetical protein
MILLYAFSNQWGTNISHRTLLELQKLISRSDINFQLVHWPKPFFHKYIEYNNYSLIIGLGDGPKFISKIKIATQAKNAYNDQTIYPFSPILLDLNLPPVDIYDSQNFAISSSMGTYNCNFLAYSTQLYLNQHSPQTFHLFLHLPQNQNAAFLAQNILKLIQDNHIC